MHKLLMRQLEESLGGQEIPPEFSDLLQKVSDTYRQHDHSQSLLESPLPLSSDEGNECQNLLGGPLAENQVSQKQLEKTLCTFDGTLDSIKEGVIVFDRDFNLLRFNKRLSELWDPQETFFYEGMHASEIAPYISSRLERGYDFNLLLDRLHKELDTAGEMLLKLNDGRVMEWYSPAQNPDVTSVGRISCFRDVTESFHVADELSRSRENLVQAQLIASVGTWEWDLSSDLLVFSDELRVMLGYQSVNIGKGLDTFTSLVPEEERQQVEIPIQRLLLTNQNFDIEHKLMRKDGSCGIYMSQGRLMRDGQGKPLRILGVVHDITRHKEAESQLRLAGRVFEVSAQGILITDSNSQILEVNQAFCEMSGWTRDELLGQSPALFSSGHHDERFYRNMWRSILGKGEWSGEVWDRRKDGSLKANWMHISAIKDAAGNVINYVAMCSDITEIKETEEQLQKLAYFDPLTGLANRTLFQEQIQDEIRRLRFPDHTLALMYLDLDRFKYVNDSLGHIAGDELLVEVAVRLRKLVRSTDIVARHGGDEFIVALVQPGSHEKVEQVAASLIKELSKPYQHAGQDIYVGVSIGICLLPEHADSFNEGMRNADSALYQAKEDGKGCYRFWNESSNLHSRRRVEVEAKLRKAIRDDQLVLYYQPQLDLFTGELLAYEALVRWEHPEDGLIFPGEFIPLAEETGLIGDLGCWVLNRACRQLQQWGEDGLERVPVAINISPHNFRTMPITQGISRALDKFEVPAELLEVEITESSAMQDPKSTRRILETLREMGVSSSIDDFGTGYSSLSYLKRFPVSKLKIDRSFVQDLSTDANDRDIAKAIVKLGQSLSMRVVAEGVETEEQRLILQGMGCDSLQGYLISRPCPASEASRFMSSDNRDDASRSLDSASL